MKPSLGWTMLSRAEISHAERALAGGDRDTRDEIGFLLIHQGFSDRFFPGTSVLHTRIRYALFIPWLYQTAASSSRRGRDLRSRVDDLQLELARRLRNLGQEKKGVIGGTMLDELTSQPPDVSYWSALRTWGIVLDDVGSRAEARRRLEAARSAGRNDDNGDRMDDRPTEVFRSLPPPPAGWDKPDSPVVFRLPTSERTFMRERLMKLARADGKLSLLGRLSQSRLCVQEDSAVLPHGLDAVADEADKAALEIARHAAALTAVGRAAYGALVEHLIIADGRTIEPFFQEQLSSHLDEYGDDAGRCDIEQLHLLIPSLPLHVREVLARTRDFAREGAPEKFTQLLACYRDSECRRKGPRARLANTGRAILRRRDWNPDQHNTDALHYRWFIVRDMLDDLFGAS